MRGSRSAPPSSHPRHTHATARQPLAELPKVVYPSAGTRTRSGACMEGAELTLGLLVFILVLAIAAKRMRMAYPIVLVLGGLAISQVPGLPPVRLDPEIFFLLILPPLLYVDGIRSPWREFRANINAILFLSVGLVL